MNNYIVSELSLEENNHLGVWNFYAGNSRTMYEHPFTMIAFVAKGKGCHRIVDKDISVSEGDIFVINPCVSHCFYSDDPDMQMTLYCCCFHPKAFPDYYRGIESSFPELKDLFNRRQAYLYVHDNQKHDVQNIFLSMLEDFSRGLPGCEYTLKCFTIILLSKIFRIYLTKEYAFGHCPNQWVDLSIQLITKNLNQKLTLEYLAREANISVSQLNRLFKKHTGMSVIEYINHLRIEKIKYLLVNTTRPIDVIATEYKLTPTYLNRLFKKQTGYTMAQYRKEFH